MLSAEDQKVICAQQENPFVENKPYNPLDVMDWVVNHLLDGFAPVDQAGSDYAKRLYIATIQVLAEQDVDVSEYNVIRLRTQIKAHVGEVSADPRRTPDSPSGRRSSSRLGSTPAEPKAEVEAAPAAKPAVKPTACTQPGTDPDAGRGGRSISFAGYSVKKEWVKWAAIAILVLLAIKFLRN